MIQPIFPYFLNAKLNQLDEATRAALREGFKNHYLGLAGDYSRVMESKDADERQLGIFFCKLEYKNLYKALTISLEKQETIDVFFCLDKYFELVNDISSKLKLSEFVCTAQEAYPSEIRTGEIGLDIVMALERLARCYLETKKYQEARETNQKVLKLYQELSDLEERQKQLYIANTYEHFGRVAEALREFEQAKSDYQQALDIYIAFSDRYSQASTYFQLGRVAEEQEDYPEAKANFEKALEIFIEYKDEYHEAIVRRALERI